MYYTVKEHERQISEAQAFEEAGLSRGSLIRAFANEKRVIQKAKNKGVF